jgi:hypothetical protein
MACCVAAERILTERPILASVNSKLLEKVGTYLSPVRDTQGHELSWDVSPHAPALPVDDFVHYRGEKILDPTPDTSPRHPGRRGRRAPLARHQSPCKTKLPHHPATRALRHDDHGRGSVRKEWGGPPGSRTCRSPACPGSPRPSSQSSKWMATATGREPPAEGPLAANSRGEHLHVASPTGWRGISPIGFPSEREPWQKAPEVCSFREAATNQRLKDGLLAANSGCVHSHPAPAAIKDLVGIDSSQTRETHKTGVGAKTGFASPRQAR